MTRVRIPAYLNAIPADDVGVVVQITQHRTRDGGMRDMALVRTDLKRTLKVPNADLQTA